MLEESLILEKTRRQLSGASDTSIDPNLFMSPEREVADLNATAVMVNEASQLLRSLPEASVLSPPAANPLFDLNRTVFSPSDRYLVRTGVPEGKPIDERLHKFIVASQRPVVIIPVSTQRRNIDKKWALVVNKYIIGQSLGPLVDTLNADLLGRVVFNNSYEIRPIT